MKRNLCSINDSWAYNGLKVVFMENTLLKIGILVDRGSDIFHFEFKPVGKNVLLRLDKDIVNPKEVFSQMRHTNSQFEDYYYGGWQEILPNSAPMHFRGAELGQHGEVSLIPWKSSIIKNTPQEVSLKVWTQALRVPILIEKTLTIKQDDPTLYIDESLTNLTSSDLNIMWGHHVAFGLEFLEKGGSLKTSAQEFEGEKMMPENRIFQALGIEKWPLVSAKAGDQINGEEILPIGKQFSDLAYLSGFEDKAYYSISTEEMTFSLHWDKEVFKSLWYWQERYATKGAPWWGNTYAIALEPWTSKWLPSPSEEQMIDEWLLLEAGEKKETSLKAICSLST